MRRGGRGRWVVIGLLALAAIAAVAVLASSIALYRGYRPSTPGVERYLLLADHRSSLEWLDRQHAATVALLVLTVLAGVGCTVMLATRRRWAWGVALVGTLAGAAGAVASLATSAAVQWDQLALWAVTVGTDMKGYEAGTRTPLVRFLVVDGREVDPTDYELVLAVHMAAPVIAVVGLLVAIAVAGLWGGDQAVWRRTKVASSSTASTASGNAG